MNKQSTCVVDSNTDTFKIKQLTEENCRLHSVIEHIQASAPQWVSVDDRLPTENKNYIVNTVEEGVLELEFYRCPEYGNFDWSCPLTGDEAELTVLDWQPLPAAPEVL